MSEQLLRFMIGGMVVSLFALLGDVLRPKSFAGLFGAAPSVALATLGLALWKHGTGYSAAEACAMIFGALGLGTCAMAVCHLLMRAEISTLPATVAALSVWALTSFGLQWLVLR